MESCGWHPYRASDPNAVRGASSAAQGGLRGATQPRNATPLCGHVGCPAIPYHGCCQSIAARSYNCPSHRSDGCQVSKKKSVKAKTTTKSQVAAVRAKYPRHSVEKALRIPKAIIEQNAGKACTPKEAAAFLGATSAAGPFAVEISSAMKYGFLERPEAG